jgi:MFS family permease
VADDPNYDSAPGKENSTPDSGGVPLSPTGNTGPFASLRIRNFRLLLTGTVFSNAGQFIQQIALSWLVYDLTGSGTMLGSINLVRALASLGMIPLAGILVDRANRRNLMLITNGWLFTITLGLGLTLLFNGSHIVYLFIFAFLGGLTQSVDQTLRQVVIFNLVPRASTPGAVALVQTGWALMRSFGPAIGGFLILWFGPAGNFLVQAGAYALIAITILQLRFPPWKSEALRNSPLRNIKEGVQYVVRDRFTRTFALMGFVLPIFIIPTFGVLPPIYAVNVFHGGADTLGFLTAAVGMGGVVGGVVSASLGRLERRGLVQLAALLMLSLSLIAFAFSTTLKVALPLLALAGFFEMIFLTTNQTLLQLSIPDDLRGRVTSVVNLNIALSPLGGLMAGVGSDLLGGPSMITIVLSGIAAAIAVLVFLTSPTIRNYRLSQGIRAKSTKTPIASGA